jgi:hypothetical protein
MSIRFNQGGENKIMNYEDNTDEEKGSRGGAEARRKTGEKQNALPQRTQRHQKIF